MTICSQLLALFLVMFGTACADDMPVTARYVPADCPPATASHEADAAADDVAIAPDPAPELADDPEPQPEERAPARTAASTNGIVNLNTANPAELVSLPGVGPALAARIVAYRDKRAFEKPEDLLRVRGIGPAKFAKLRDMIAVRGAAQKRRP